MSNTDDRESVISALRACLISAKGGVLLSILNREYKLLVGSPVPFRSFGYSTVEDFLRSVKDINVKYSPKGEVLVEAVPTAQSAHIASLVNRQKSNSKKRPIPSFGRSRKPGNQSRSHYPPSNKSGPPPPPVQRSLSVTVNNDFRDEPRRMVSVRKKVSPTDENRYRYDLPPRLQNRKDEIESASYYEEEASRYDNKNVNELEMSFENCNIDSDNHQVREDFDGYQSGFDKNSRRDITTPFTPRNALAAGRAQMQAKAAKELEEKYTSPNKGYEDFDAESYDDYNMDVAPWNRFKPGLTRPPPSDVSEDDAPYTVKLLDYCNKKGWLKPVYKLFPRNPKNQQTVYGCQVKVGSDQHYNSYPDESIYPQEAKELAAKKAFLKLLENDTDLKANGFNITTDLKVVQKRIYTLVANHRGGLWAKVIPALYSSEFKEQLPSNWLEKASTFSDISLDSVWEGKTIVKVNKTDDSLARTNVSANVSSPTPLVTPKQVCVINAQEIPAAYMWDVFVTHVVSSNEVWIRLIGPEYSEQYAKLSHNMEMYYSSEKSKLPSPPSDLHKDSYYAARINDEYSTGDTWHRIYVEQINWPEKTAEVWLVDNGETDTVPLKQIYQLFDTFAALPKQAVLCSLAGLENYIDDEVTLDLMAKMLLGNVFVAQVMERDADRNVYSVILYDTSSDDDVNVNEQLINQAILGVEPTLPGVMAIKEVNISHITESGMIYVQVQADASTYLENLIADLSVDVIISNSLRSVHEVKINKLYLVKFNVDENWYRAVITGVLTSSENKVKVLFVDYGNSEVVDITDVSELDQISFALARMPKQALPVMLSGVEIGPKECIQLKKMIRENDSVILKIIESGDIPKVEIFKRTSEPEGELALISVNNSIVIENNYQPTRANSIRRSRSLTRSITPSVSRPISPVVVYGDTVHHSLNPPKIPNIGSDFFDIFVTMAANPSNFIVQPLNNINSLKELIAEMKIFYNTCNDPGIIVSPDNLVDGGLYAALFENNEWFRVTLSSVIPDRVSVHSCDFGEYTIVTADKLRYLAPQFTQLSYQGIKAKLAGIRPTHTDWTVQDCVRFQELVVEKQLVSIVMENGPDVINPSETVLGLQIIDTSTDEDIVIGEILVEERRAIQIQEQQ